MEFRQLKLRDKNDRKASFEFETSFLVQRR
jgi:hypothetical protein